jgi:hypothetical protein
MEPRQPVIHISSYEHDSWVPRLEAALIQAGLTTRPTFDIPAVDVALVLLSPQYLDSEFGRAALRTFTDRVRGGRLRLIPIVASRCRWQDVEELWGFEVFAARTPLDAMTPTQLDGALKNLTSDIAELAQGPPDPAKIDAARARSGNRKGSESATPEFAFSEGVELAVKEASALASRSARGGLTSSCLLFGLADCGVDPNDTANLIRRLMDRDGRYEVARNEFLSDKRDYAGAAVFEIAGVGKVSRNARAIIERAAEIALQTRVKSGQIHQRHLLAAILLTGGDSAPHARRQLIALGLSVPAICEELLKHVSADPRDEDLKEWEKILPTTRHPQASEPAQRIERQADPYVSGPAGYSSEFCGVGGTHPVPDHLKVGPMAERLAELIALKETRMPLAIGLFGNWGSGKSHFMNLMDRHLKKVSEKCKKEGGGAWCHEVVPIYFNAWHYLDSNLWASLVTEIFDGLFRHLEKQPDRLTQLSQVKKRLQEAGGAAARAEEEVKEAQAAVDSAAAGLAEARKNSEGAHQIVRGLLDSLRSLVPEMTTGQTAQNIFEWLGVSAEKATLTQLVAKQRDMASVPGQLHEIWRRIIAPPGRWWRIGWLLGPLVLFPLTLEFGIRYSDVIRSRLGWIAIELRWVMLDAITLLLWLSPYFAELRQRLSQLNEIVGRAEKAQENKATDQAVIAAKRQVEAADAAAVAAEAKLAAARSLEQQLTLEAESLRPDRRLYRMIESRARSADYRGQLGLISLARKDFQELSDIFADRDALAAKLAGLKDPQDVKELKLLSNSIDRIVLFIDDLDRCQPEKVVEVLQAVHLLLAFRLFAVVVGVDQRCLRQSLRIQARGLLTDTDEKTAPPVAVADLEAERPATPLDYLEKIFHVPFHLPPMEQGGFTALVENLAKPPADSAEKSVDEVSPTVSPSGAATGAVTLPVPRPKVSESSNPADLAASIADAEQEIQKQQEVAPTRVPVVGSVPLEKWEWEALAAYHQLVRTPRGVTRLLNTYRLVRAGVAQEEWAAFCGDQKANGEFRITMLLLAAAAGSPAVARDWFKLLYANEPSSVFDSRKKSDDARWLPFKEVYDDTIANARPQRTRADFVKWIDRVEQFAF